MGAPAALGDIAAAPADIVEAPVDIGDIPAVLEASADTGRLPLPTTAAGAEPMAGAAAAAVCCRCSVSPLWRCWGWSCSFSKRACRGPGKPEPRRVADHLQRVCFVYSTGLHYFFFRDID